MTQIVEESETIYVRLDQTEKQAIDAELAQLLTRVRELELRVRPKDDPRLDYHQAMASNYRKDASAASEKFTRLLADMQELLNTWKQPKQRRCGNYSCAAVALSAVLARHAPRCERTRGPLNCSLPHGHQGLHYQAMTRVLWSEDV